MIFSVRVYRSITTALAVLFLSSAGGAISSARLSEYLIQVPLPLGAEIEWISHSATHNGVPTSIAAYDSPLTHQQTLQFYQTEWPDEKDPPLPGFIDIEIGGWLIISRFRDGVNSVVQLDLADSQQSQGFVSVTDARKRIDISKNLNNIPGVELLSQTSSTDQESFSTLSVYQSGQSPKVLSDSLLRELQGNGWELIALSPLTSTQVASMHRQRWGKKQRIDMIVSRDSAGQSIAVVSEVSHEN